jgi:hypothetical protein
LASSDYPFGKSEGNKRAIKRYQRGNQNVPKDIQKEING